MKPSPRRLVQHALVWSAASSRALRRGTLALLPLGLALAPALARAACLGPRTELLWTYPDAATATVAPNSVFWAISHRGELSVEIDGEPLTPLGTSAIERQQFVTAGPLSEGDHEFYARAEEPADATEAADGGRPRISERRLHFTVVPREIDELRVNIESVTIYPLSWSGNSLTNPPESEYDTQCSSRAIPLAWSCDDIIPDAVARVAFEERGGRNAFLPPIAYLAQGGVLLPAGCPQHWVGAHPEGPASSFRVASVLSAGISDEQVYDGEIEVRTPYPARSGRPDACSLSGAGPGAPGVPRAGAFFCTLALLGGFARRSRRGRIRRSFEQKAPEARHDLRRDRMPAVEG